MSKKEVILSTVGEKLPTDWGAIERDYWAGDAASRKLVFATKDVAKC